MKKDSKQGGFTAIALMIATVILIVASLSFTQNYSGIKERASMNVYQAADDRLDQIKNSTGLGDGTTESENGPESQVIDLGIDDGTSTPSSIVSSTTSPEGESLSIKLFYVGDDASGGAETSGKTIVCDNFILIPTDANIPLTKETIKGSVTALSSKDYESTMRTEFGPFNFLTAEGVSFKSASISSGVATVKLVHDSGYSQKTSSERLDNFNQNIGLILTAEKRDCVIREQVKNTALQFNTAKSVKVYIDDVLLK